MKHLLRGIAGLLAVLLLPVAVFGYPLTFSEALHEYAQEQDLFLEGFAEDESLEGEKHTIGSGNYSPWGNREAKVSVDYFTYPYLTRTMGKSLTLEDNRTVVEYVLLAIPEGKTLTIPEGKTLIVYGEILIRGELVNNGTIIVGDAEWASKKKRSTDPEGTDQSRIRNYGKLVNAGAVELVHGTVHTIGEGNLENSGTIVIRNADEKLLGLQFTARGTGREMLNAKTVNTGEIYVENVGGTGILIRRDCAFDNQGAIYRTKESVLRGTYTGNRSRGKPAGETGK